MAFNVSYHRLADYNIRNLYGGLPPEIRFRKPPYTLTVSAPSRYHVRPQDPLDERLFDYYQDMDIRLPRAPAFRILSSKRVDDIVRRLSHATVSSASRLWKPGVCERGAARSLTPRCSSSPQSTPRSLVSSSSRSPTPSPRRMKRQEMDSITDRLLRPTVSAKVRRREKTLETFSVREIQTACDKIYVV